MRKFVCLNELSESGKMKEGIKVYWLSGRVADTLYSPETANFCHNLSRLIEEYCHLTSQSSQHYSKLQTIKITNKMVCSGDAVFDTDITFNTLCSVSFLNDCGWGLSHVIFYLLTMEMEPCLVRFIQTLDDQVKNYWKIWIKYLVWKITDWTVCLKN